MKFRYVGDRPNKTTKRFVKSKDADGNPVVRTIEKPDDSPDANNQTYTSFFGVRVPTNGDVVELPREHKTYDLALAKLKNNHHFEIVDDGNRAQKQSTKKTKSASRG